MDGRLRGTSQELLTFALFFAIEQSCQNKDCNLAIAPSALTVSCSLELPNKRSIDKVYAANELPQIPLMWNPAIIKKGKRLLCLEDKGVSKASVEVTKQKAKELLKKAKKEEQEKKTSAAA